MLKQSLSPLNKTSGFAPEESKQGVHLGDSSPQTDRVDGIHCLAGTWPGTEHN